MTNGSLVSTTTQSQQVIYVGRQAQNQLFYYPTSTTAGDASRASQNYRVVGTATFAPLQGTPPQMMKQWRYLYGTFVTDGADTMYVTGINTKATVTAASGTTRFRAPLDTRGKALGITITDSTVARTELGNFLFYYVRQQWEN